MFAVTRPHVVEVLISGNTFPLNAPGFLKTFTVTFCESDCVPDVPVTRNEVLPGSVTASAVASVNVDMAVPLAGGVTDADEKDGVDPSGFPVTVNATGALNPLRLRTVIV